MTRRSDDKPRKRTSTAPRNLLDDRYLVVEPELAMLVGLNESIVLRQLHRWLSRSGHEREGRRWIYNSYAQWQAQLPFWNEHSIRRMFYRLTGRGLVTTRQFGMADGDATLWYSIDYDALDALAAFESQPPDAQGARSQEVTTQPAPEPAGGLPPSGAKSQMATWREAPDPHPAPGATPMRALAPPPCGASARLSMEQIGLNPEGSIHSQAAAAQPFEPPDAASGPAAAAAAQGDRPQPISGPPTAFEAAVAALVAETFDRADAERLVRRTEATAAGVLAAADKARRQAAAGKLRTTHRGYIVACLERGDPPEGEQPKTNAEALAERVDRERAARAAESARWAAEAAEAEAEYGAAREVLAAMSPDDLSQLVDAVLPRCGGAVRAGAAQGGPLSSRVLVLAMTSELRRGWRPTRRGEQADGPSAA